MARQAKTGQENWLQGTVSQVKAEKPSAYQGGRPKFPGHLSRVARTEMKRCVKVLEQRGTVTEGDFATLAVYAEVYARWIQCKREIGDSLMVTTTITDNHGKQHIVERLNPLLKIVAQCETRM